MATRIRTSTQVNFADFNKRMQSLGQRVFRRSNEGVQETALQTVNNLINDTPKLTNQAAANWQVAIGSRPSEFKEGFTDLSAAKAEARAVILSREAGQSVYITNNTPYIGELNRGSSRQAPANFIEKSMQRARTFIKSHRLLKNG